MLKGLRRASRLRGVSSVSGGLAGTVMVEGVVGEEDAATEGGPALAALEGLEASLDGEVDGEVAGALEFA